MLGESYSLSEHGQEEENYFSARESKPSSYSVIKKEIKFISIKSM